jgi:hypothetical protein
LITPHGIYCYKVMTFGLKMPEQPTKRQFKRARQIGKSVEAYVDDVVVKTKKEDKLIADLTETFANLREFQWKLNPTKCVFGVPSGLLLASWSGIEANPAKIDAIRKMAKPSNKKDVMKLTGMMEALGRCISKLGEKGLPFFKLLKKADKFVWDDEAQKTFEALKESLTTPPVMTPPHLQYRKKHSYSTSLPQLMWSAQFSLPSEKKKGRPTLFNDLCIT